MNFQKITIIVASIVLVLMLSGIGYLLSQHRGPKMFPPVASECPDYWVSLENSCTNPKNLGNLTANCKGPKNFNKNFVGHNADCLKSKWAKTCGLSWQGLTNNPNVCKKLDSK